MSRIDLLRRLDPEELRRLEPETPIETVPKGALIASPHDGRHRLYLIKAGSVRLYKLTAGGKELTVDLLGAGHIFGEIGTFTTGSDNLYAEARETSVICSIDKARFDRLIGEHPQLALHFIEIVSNRLKEVEEMMERMAYGSVRQRLLFLLGKLTDKYGTALPAEANGGGEPGWVRLDVGLTHQELAAMAGSIRETVTDALNALAADGIVSKEGLRKPLRVHRERLRAAMEEG
ncbi:Crp/Fnr family transcriptional regulator [Paenibacillus flagellatus]|uniref:Crp/Fnr family transcriptional regulator n=1 Tax=Paenibacillus flagellatus TaxID=2211139 RepID=UPI001FE9EA91|nr:Crp/Fnr family transcriptional regulator [Paenibacillus flagellatus]